MTSSVDRASPVAAFGSPWHEGRLDSDGHPALGTDLDVDVAVVGGGIVGLATAWRLREAGASVAVLEAREVAAATSGNTTAKLSSLQGLAYSQLARHGQETAARFADANEAGIAWIASLVEGLGIECGWQRTANHTFADDPAELPKLERELEASRGAGLATELVSEAPLPFAISGAVRLEGQAQFDPVAFLRHLATVLDDGDQMVFERTRVSQVLPGQVRTETGFRVSADHIVLATHLPISDRVGLFARVEPMASFAITVQLQQPVVGGMFIDTAGRHSLRSAEIDGTRAAIVAGHGHRLGTGDPLRSLAELERYALDRLDAPAARYRFDAHDFVTEDRLPFVGFVHPGSETILTATGMNKWGLALGAECGRMLAETVNTGEPGWPAAFDIKRLPRPRSLPTLAANGVKTGWHLLRDRLRRTETDRIQPGGGAIVGSGLGQEAVHRDDDGRLHRLSARCTHLGCIVAYNQAARTWDCPCHGSRFDTDGTVLEGPASAPLQRKSAPHRSGRAVPGG
jgi:glycine/D-amino acid oxidase-like deaminating enzyme/nitrite reductase/ring-hydroxylating ferredoxin subunit